MNKTTHVLLGYSGHSYVVLEAAREAGIIVTAYADYQKAKDNPYGLEYLGFEGDEAFPGWKQPFTYLLGVGDNYLRAKIADLVSSKGAEMTTVISPGSLVSETAKIEQGTFVNKGAMINAQVTIGKGCIINTGAIVEHECSIGSYSHIAPGAVLAGNVSIGQYVFVGANAVIREGVKVGDGAVIGAGTVVIQNVLSNNKIVGNPGRSL